METYESKHNKPKAKYLTLQIRDGKKKDNSGYMPDFVGHRLLLRKWPAVRFQAL